MLWINLWIEVRNLLRHQGHIFVPLGFDGLDITIRLALGWAFACHGSTACAFRGSTALPSARPPGVRAFAPLRLSATA